MEQYLSTFEDLYCVVANSIELVHSTKDFHTFTMAKDFTFLPLTLSRHFLERFHMALLSPCCHLDFAVEDFLALITADVTAIFT